MRRTVRGVEFFIWAPIQFGSIRQPSYAGQSSSLGEGMGMTGLIPKTADGRLIRARRIGNPHGSGMGWKSETGERFPHPAPQLPQRAKTMVWNHVPNWPLMADGSKLSNLECLSASGCRPIWEYRSSAQANETADSVWRATPITLWGRLLEEAIRRRGEWFDMAQVCQDSSEITESPHIVSGQRALGQFRTEDMTPDWSAAPRANWSYDDDFPHTADGPAEALMRVHEQAHGIDKITALLSGLVSRTQAIYRADWRHWVIFCDGSNRSQWLDITESGWGEPALEFIIHEHRVLWLNPRTIRSKISGVRFSHIVEGRGDFSPMEGGINNS